MKKALKHIGLNILLVLVPLTALVMIVPPSDPGNDWRMLGVITVSVYVFFGSVAVEALKRFIRPWQDNRLVTFGPAITVYLLFLGVVVQSMLG